MKKILAVVLAAFPAAVLAEPPNACEIIKPTDINPIAVSKVERVQPQKSGNPSQCAFLDSRKAAVLVVSLRRSPKARRRGPASARPSLDPPSPHHSPHTTLLAAAAAGLPDDGRGRFRTRELSRVNAIRTNAKSRRVRARCSS
jgi:hypothetical protein